MKGNAEANVYMIDKEFCRKIQGQLAVAMGLVARHDVSSKDAIAALNKIAEIRSYFEKEKLAPYSNRIRDSIDIERFMDPYMPEIKA